MRDPGSLDLEVREDRMNSYRSTRREFLDAAGLAAATTLVAPFVRTAHSAGKLTLLLWDHWVPGANDVMRQLIEAWADPQGSARAG
ncbi:MAG: Twin-arginine translocation pathway signal [Microvirga sp.]|nr:Twin-arginine translocation pathway signal [Microvirga sp.]